MNLSVDLNFILPLIILVSAGLIAMLMTGFYRNHMLTASISFMGLLAALASLYVVSLGAERADSLFIADDYSLFFQGMFFVSSMAIILISYPYMNKQTEQSEEFYILLITATIGAAVLVISRHFISFFMGLEILSVSLYSMIAYLPERRKSVEAGIKYLVLAAASSAFLLFGMALVYAGSGTMDFYGIGEIIAAGRILSPLMFTGLAMMLVAVGFKLALVPFHLWTPDVYEGAPAPVTSFVATVSKASMFALWFRFIIITDLFRFRSFVVLFTVLAIATMFTGNFLALMQNNLKRLLAYSSIAHMGYMMIAFVAGGRAGVEAAAFYLVAYVITTLGTFGIVTVLSDKDHDAEDLEYYRGLLWKKPLLATAFTAMLLSLAGIPLTAGFIGKFYLAAAGINSALWLLVIILVINSAISIYYYLKIVVVMYSSETEEKGGIAYPALSIGSSAVLTVLTFALIWLGVSPEGMVSLVRYVVTGMSTARQLITGF